MQQNAARGCSDFPECALVSRVRREQSGGTELKRDYGLALAAK